MSGTLHAIDRENLVLRHAVRITAPDPQNVLTVGNGDFAYTSDITGMQSLTSFHDQSLAMRQRTTAVNTATMSSWGWHEMPNPSGFALDDAMTEHTSRRGPVRYPDKHDMEGSMRGAVSEENAPGAWLNANPQRIDLGRIGLMFRTAEGNLEELTPGLLSDTEQTLDPYTGIINSHFTYEGETVVVSTVAGPDSSTVGFSITSPLLSDGALQVVFRFPYAHSGFFQTSDWDHPEAHQSKLVAVEPTSATIQRHLDGTSYRVEATFNDGELQELSAHQFVLRTASDQLHLTVEFLDPGTSPAGTGYEELARRSADSWAEFWASGAAIDFSGSSDPRAHELERRAILSQYLTRVNCSGVMPPAETGLTTNSWQGKAHLEMHFWHGAHFPAWGRPELLERSLDWYLEILGQARVTAARQGYPGVRWPKQVGPDGRESPDPIGSFLIWQQPHILYLLELVWNASPEESRARLLEDFADLVEDTAAFMAAFAEERDGAFHLLSPVMPAQEFYDVTTTEDPTYELAYWWWGLEIAQQWRERKGNPRHHDWSAVQNGLATPHTIEGRYTAIATEPYLRRDDHPALLAAFGVVPPTPIIDRDTMEATLSDVLNNWDWPTAWGWDFPVLAMTASRLGQPDVAIDALLRDEQKNQFTVTGHNSQMGSILPIYLPGNGALLSALSMLATADNGQPAFPEGWTVKAEGFTPWP